jgi:hypothetical protein
VGVICWGIIEDYLVFSFSQCHPTDQFSKKIGRSIAQHRLENLFVPKEVPQIGYCVDGTKMRMTPILDVIRYETDRFSKRQSSHTNSA